MPKTTYLARVSVLSAEEEDGRMAFICSFNEIELNDVILN
jgi:hypothetical protein